MRTRCSNFFCYPQIIVVYLHVKTRFHFSSLILENYWILMRKVKYVNMEKVIQLEQKKNKQVYDVRLNVEFV